MFRPIEKNLSPISSVKLFPNLSHLGTIHYLWQEGDSVGDFTEKKTFF